MVGLLRRSRIISLGWGLCNAPTTEGFSWGTGLALPKLSMVAMG